jgi:hypothetical protein
MQGEVKSSSPKRNIISKTKSHVVKNTMEKKDVMQLGLQLGFATIATTLQLDHYNYYGTKI